LVNDPELLDPGADQIRADQVLAGAFEGLPARVVSSSPCSAAEKIS
jgi:hypothetical protein